MSRVADAMKAGTREELGRAVSVSDRQHDVLGPPDDLDGTRVTPCSRRPLLADRAPYAAKGHARAQYTQGLGDVARRVAVALLKQSTGDPARIVKAARETRARRLARAPAQEAADER